MCKKLLRVVIAAVVFATSIAALSACQWCDEHSLSSVLSSTSTETARDEALKIHRSSAMSASPILCPDAEEYFFKRLKENDEETETTYFEFEQTADYGIKEFVQKNYGSVFYQKPENVRIDFYQGLSDGRRTNPSRTIVINGKKFYDYNSATNQCVIADWDKIKAGAGGGSDDFFMSFRSDNIKKLKDKYNVRLVELSSSVVRLSVFMEGVKSAHHLSPSDAGVIMNMDFDLSSPDAVVPLRTDFISGAVRFTTEMKKFTKNPPLPDRNFFKKYTPPRGAEIIK